ncbi:hypothetical protein [Companilactobacillus sp.]|jgi:hypothetical protein|uniref:hypothetical protein n=1 Tax=Companilactobacillus sp. TaxID=2767905 RepID=UPI0025C17AE8|nr:hypothetical protein [Companilactobacillus sp.]MCH4010278.1 hypothetical protein [Companilactobacillus sp.]MCH4052046.1 hypothetical protein [Companilactobacillus sp.]MCH4078220.1 hypothetical protein [Companilactobacillus sp.]MCH4126796.1 hypothetical protein [Companilactobacillus sp.]MCH4132635.1 hypothetical protein [Companilactobacillus sp.]
MKYSPENVKKISELVDQCLSDPEIADDKYLVDILGEINQKVKYQKRFRNMLNLRKEAGVFSRKHGFKMPEYLNELINVLNDVLINKGSKNGWLSAFHNLD